MMQMLHQVTVMHCSLAIYDVFSKTVVFFTVFMRVNVEIRDEIFSALKLGSTSVVRQTHETDNSVSFYASSN